LTVSGHELSAIGIENIQGFNPMLNSLDLELSGVFPCNVEVVAPRYREVGTTDIVSVVVILSSDMN
jgi:hypothetical protein